jgi:EAL domain-containing protein (putative c-di-GMP-specific phosphodiesterase class I)
MGFAYSTGDILVELDRSYQVQNVDGAVQTIFGENCPLKESINFLDIVDTRTRQVIKRLTQSVEGHQRIGPVDISIAVSNDELLRFVGFFSHLPVGEDRLYLALVRPSRHGTVVESKSVVETSETERRDDFFGKMEKVFQEGAQVDDVAVTIFNSDSGPQSLAKQQEIQDYLSSLSIGGNHATALSDDKYALVHDRGDGELSEEIIANELARATGVKLQAATVEVDTDNTSNSDSVRAMIFGLQQFADNVDEFGIESFQEGGAQLVEEAASRVKQFRDIIDRDAFSLVYQPIVDLHSGETHHFEVLARFDHLGVGKSPQDTIVFAEQAGLIDSFDIAVFAKSIKKMYDMDKTSILRRLSVNISGRSISKASFVKSLLEQLKAFELSRQFLALEITESCQINDILATADVIAEIRALGYEVHLDDFGAGASGFQYLKKFKVDALKIDGEYVKDSLNSREDRAYLSAMITLCKELNIKTVAEWIESAEHASLVRMLGADYGQGYYFGTPQATMVGAGKVHMAS